MRGYREEDGVAPDSQTKTFVALTLLLDNWRWQGVPFYLRTRVGGRPAENEAQWRQPVAGHPGSAG